MGNAIKVLTRIGLSDALNNIKLKPKTAMQLNKAIHDLQNKNMLELETKGIIKKVTHNNADGDLYSYVINRHTRLLFTKEEHIIKIVTVEDSSNKRTIKYH